MWKAICGRAICAETDEREKSCRLQRKLRLLGRLRRYHYPAPKKSVDVDIKNARPNLLLNEMRDCDTDFKLGALGRYCANYVRWGKSAGYYMGLSEGGAKIDVTKVFTVRCRPPNSPSDDAA